jgi:hypothetical protein
MKIALQYVHDSTGKIKFIQIPLKDWEKILAKLKKYEQTFKLRSELVEAFDQVKEHKKSNSKKQQLNDFLNDL